MKVLRFLVAVIVWALYEAVCDGSGIGIKERWHRVMTYAREGKRVRDVRDAE